MRYLWKFLKTCVLLTLLILVGAGFYAGNMVYQQLFYQSWDQALGIPNHLQDLDRIHYLERYYDWDRVAVSSTDGTKLQGTYIEAPRKSHKTVIILHGLYQNRTMSVPYIGIYRRLGYNVLLPDVRGHGESEGSTTDWGVHAVDDLDSWVQLLRQQDPNVEIGFHGVSLGAAMSLIYAGAPQGHEAKFYVADSSYGDVLELGQAKLLNYTGDQRLLLGMRLINPFFQAAMFYHTHKLLSDVDPAIQVGRMTSPVLFLHGTSDELIPMEVGENLVNRSASQNKKLVLFQGSAHAVALATNPRDYRRTVRKFVQEL